MKNFLNNRPLIALILSAVFVLAMSVGSLLFEGEASPVSNVTGVLLTPFRAIGMGISGLITSGYEYLHDVENIKAENERLKKQIAEMEDRIRISEQAIDENEQLRVLLNLSERRRDFQFVMTEILSRGGSNWESTFNLGKGTAHGIEPFDCVINEEGFIVGFISEVGLNWSVVTTIVDSGIELGAMVYRTREPAVAEGDLSLMAEGLLKLTFLREDTILLNGDTILTSGVGGVYPKDLVIGTVSEVRPDESGLGKYAILKPSVQLDKLTKVFVITEFTIAD